MKGKPKKAPTKADGMLATSSALLADIRRLIEETRSAVAVTVNAGMTMMYWSIGKRILEEVLKGERATYGDQIVATLSQQLVSDYGQGFAEKNLRRMVQFAEVFPDVQIVVTLSRQLGWSHFITLIPLKKPLQRDFYAEMCRLERWSVRTLRQKVNSMLYERTAISRKPEEVAAIELQQLREEDQLTPDLVFRDPYFLDFLGLTGAYSEKDLENAILRDLEAFLVEMGSDFAFLARQKRMVVDNDDFYLDLLFYHRSLRRLVAVELKLGKFAPADLGQMEFYLRWLKKYEQRPDEGDPIGLILCADKSNERVELLELAAHSIRVAQYYTELPPREVLQQRLHDAVRLAKERLEHLSAHTEKTGHPAKAILATDKQPPKPSKTTKSKRGFRK